MNYSDIFKGYFPLFVITLIQVILLNSYYPLTGIDVAYYSSKLLDILLHFKNEGVLLTQWWTPSFGGGIPGFPSPVHYQYSLTPYLMLIFSPWVSTVLTYLIFNVIGYLLIFNYVKNHSEMGLDAAVISAVVFTTSGFWISHSLIGHLSYHTFPLISVVPYILSSKWSLKKQTIVFSTTIIYMVHSGAFFPIYLTYLSLIQLMFFFLILNKVRIKNLFRVLIFAHLIILGVSISKLVAVSLHMEVIPRVDSYSSWQHYAIALPFANLFQLFSWRFLYPIESFLPVPADSILFWFCGSRYEFWENDTSVSPIVLPLIIFFIYKFKDKIGLIIKKRKFLFSLLLFTFWFSAEISIGKGFFWNLISNFPVIKSTHVNVRYCGSIILFLTIFCSFCFFYLFNNKSVRKRRFVYYFSISISILSMLSYIFFIKEKEGFLSHDHTIENDIWEKIQNGNHMVPIKEILDTNTNDHFSHYEKNASSFMPHDPLYGYHGHYFLPVTKKGSIKNIDENENFNFHNPMSFYNPKLANGKRELIHSSDNINFKLFINRKQPKWELPTIQKVANYITIISLIIYIFIVSYSYLKKSKIIKL